MKTEFEEFCDAYELSKYARSIAKATWDVQQAKIDKLEHDLGNERCANRMLQHVLDKEVKS